MSYCRYCGNKLNEVAKFCPNCGAALVAETNSEVFIQQVPESREPQQLVARPVGIVVLAFLEGLVSLFTLIAGMALIGLAAFLATGSLDTLSEEELERAFREMPWTQAFAGVRVIALTTGILMIIGIIILLLSIIGLVMAWGLWTGKRWAQTITVVLAVINILIGLFSLPGSILSILIFAAIIYYLTRPHVKAYYHRR